MQKVITYKIDEIKLLTDTVMNLISNFLDNKSTVIGLEGELGSGKTTFVKRLLMDFEVMETVISPTFILHREYNGKYKNKSLKINHLDYYRIEEENELDELRINKIVQERSLTFIEWADKFKEHLVSLKSDNVRILWIKFYYIDENTRKVLIKEL